MLNLEVCKLNLEVCNRNTSCFPNLFYYYLQRELWRHISFFLNLGILLECLYNHSLFPFIDMPLTSQLVFNMLERRWHRKLNRSYTISYEFSLDFWKILLGTFQNCFHSSYVAYMKRQRECSSFSCYHNRHCLWLSIRRSGFFYLKNKKLSPGKEIFIFCGLRRTTLICAINWHHYRLLQLTIMVLCTSSLLNIEEKHCFQRFKLSLQDWAFCSVSLSMDWFRLNAVLSLLILLVFSKIQSTWICTRCNALEQQETWTCLSSSRASNK